MRELERDLVHAAGDQTGVAAIPARQVEASG
jgi:hypothetical protein